MARERIKDFMTDRALSVGSRAGAYLRDGPGGINLEKVAVYAAFGIAAFLVWKTYKVGAAVAGGVKAVAKVPAAVGGAIGRGVYDWFHPDTVGETLYYTVQFPDGKKHSVPSKSVAKDGSFLYNNVRYRMAVDKSIVTGVNKFAVKL